MTLTGIENLDLLNAIPLYLGLFSGDPATQAEALAGLDSLNGIAAFLNLGGQGLAAFEESDDNPGYAALSGLNSYCDGASWRHRRVQRARCDRAGRPGAR